LSGHVTSRAAVTLSAVLCLAGYVWVYALGLADLPIRSDGFSYYVYLPSWFLFQDTTLAAVARDCCGGEFPDYSAIIRWPGTRRWVNAHPIGVAVMQAPLFGFAHALTKWTNLSPDGFSLYYQHAAGLSGLAWIVAGLAVLRRLLLRSFSDGVTAVTLFVLLLGTNLYHYATFDSSYSHPYSFFLFAALLILTASWHKKPAPRTSVLLGVVAGLIVLVRHPNILFLCVYVLYGAGTRGGLTATLARFSAARTEVARITAVAALVIAPQLLIYHQATGHFVVSAYGGLGFNWTSPEVFGVLFGVRKGLFFWSPLLLIAAAGLVLLSKQSRPASAFVLPGVVFLAINTYMIASWWEWQFGCSYGHRGLVDLLPVFALGLAAFFEHVSGSARGRIAAAVGVTAMVMLSVFQMLQYWYLIIPFNDTTWPQYRELFLRWS
jgi:hypothetical protein